MSTLNTKRLQEKPGKTQSSEIPMPPHNSPPIPRKTPQARNVGSIPITRSTTQQLGSPGNAGKMDEAASQLAADFCIMDIARLMRLKGLSKLRIWFKNDNRVAFEATKKEGV